MNRYEILLKGTNGREVSFCVEAHNIIGAWDVIEDITPSIAYIGAVYTLNIREL
jgi:hypothetical protein